MATELDDLKVLQDVEQIADAIWADVLRWDSFAKDVVGKQMARAVDSVGANIAESYGRFHYGEKINFLYYARGSLFETKYWINRALARNLMSSIQVDQYAGQLTKIAKQLNVFANSLKHQRHRKPKPPTLRESDIEYHSSVDEELFSQADFKWLLTYSTEIAQSPISNLQSPPKEAYEQ
ncbi:MAG: four helix bundle protein [Ardenticatenaceae bacterium]|nr:four helix bundle protein [Ardenticatenaceae bacterium]